MGGSTLPQPEFLHTQPICVTHGGCDSHDLPHPNDPPHDLEVLRLGADGRLPGSLRRLGPATLAACQGGGGVGHPRPTRPSRTVLPPPRSSSAHARRSAWSLCSGSRQTSCSGRGPRRPLLPSPRPLRAARGSMSTAALHPHRFLPLGISSGSSALRATGMSQGAAGVSLLACLCVHNFSICVYIRCIAHETLAKDKNSIACEVPFSQMCTFLFIGV